jgi:hypothetical protein
MESVIRHGLLAHRVSITHDFVNQLPRLAWLDRTGTLDRAAGPAAPAGRIELKSSRAVRCVRGPVRKLVIPV